MHLSGAILLFSYVIPPAWALDVYGTAPADDPSADVTPFVIFAVLLLHCVAFHVLVQIPSGLLGTRLGRDQGRRVPYFSAIAVASVLTVLILLVALRGEQDVTGLMRLCVDFMVRGSLGLAGYVWLTRQPAPPAAARV
ncbi:hypothetical protein [Streptomyces sp. NPDC026659]|uniref:hypothetical protein n=1 Tax=Streptomyces sp. NPDC026659 TaxID=3155123 RepID=UPI0033D4AFFE